MNEDVKSQNQSHNQPHQMNINEWRKLGEALKTYDRLVAIAEARHPGSGYVIGGWRALVAAARQTYDRWQECDCDDGMTTYPPNTKLVCFDCGGSGLLPNQARTTCQLCGGPYDQDKDGWGVCAKCAVRAFEGGAVEVTFREYGAMMLGRLVQEPPQ